MYQCATVTRKELQALQSVEGIVRMGRVVKVCSDKIVLEGGEIPTSLWPVQHGEPSRRRLASVWAACGQRVGSEAAELSNVWLGSVCSSFVMGNLVTGPLVVLIISAVHSSGAQFIARGGTADLFT